MPVKRSALCQIMPLSCQHERGPIELLLMLETFG